MAFRRSIIQLKADCHRTDFPIVKLQQTYTDGRTVKRKNLYTDGSSIEVILYCLREYLDMATELNFGTGNKHFNNFCHTLQGAAKDDRGLVLQHVPQPRTPILFYAAIKEWKAELILPSACQTMVDYLEMLMKPRNMTVKAFINRVKVMVHYINDIPFPGPDSPTVTPTKLKNIIFQAMPVAWQTNFL
jgi:hypothetical protein